MAKIRFSKTLVGDFETTVYGGQQNTEVWASALVELFTEDVKIFHSLPETFSYLVSLKKNVCVYFHNLKFDGSFWLPFLLNNLQLKQAIIHNSDAEYDLSFIPPDEMPDNSFKYSISNTGQWYTITIKIGGYYIEIRDSLKLLPFSVAKIGKDFQTKHKKLEMVYEGYRYAGCEITNEEMQYIANDVLVVKEAIEIMFNEGHKELTIGACCLKEFRSTYDKAEYKYLFPDLTEIELDPAVYDSANADQYIRKSYKGGWCYLVKGKENKVYTNGNTADVNSLYPSMMHSDSGNYFPYGLPKFLKGHDNVLHAINKIDNMDNYYYFVRFKCRFRLKDNRLPTIQIKGTYFHRSNEWLESSNIYNFKTGTYSPYIYYDNENPVLYTPTLTLTKTDFILFREQYAIFDLELLDCCYFKAEIGLFDTYINKYRDIKIKSKGALRELAKLFLNNLYGKFASSDVSSFKYAFLNDEGIVKYVTIKEHNKKTVYIPIGSAITSYARNFTIRAAQKNYYGVDRRGFIYADTDSIHCDLNIGELRGIIPHDVNFCCWKLEAQWDKAIFARQKTYIEHVISENGQHTERTPFFNIKCAGMPKTCKALLDVTLQDDKTRDTLLYSHEENEKSWFDKMTPSEQEFVSQKRDLTDFKIGLHVPSKLMPKTIKGGVILVSTTYEMR